MRLLKSLRFGFSGGQTAFLQQKMQRFTPIGQQSIHRMLIQLFDVRVPHSHNQQQYMPFHTPTFQYFVSNIQKFYLSQRQFDRRSLRIYALMQKMQMMSDSTKKIFHNNICRYLASQKTQEGIKNEKLDHLLWWLYREFPFQSKKFQQIASNYTVRLYDTFQYMNTIPNIPSWQPYIRVSYMLKMLGHQVECRTDMFNLQVLQKIDRHYFVYLIELFRKQMYVQFVQQMKTHTPLLEHLCDQYIIGDDVDYDKYLQRIEIIDNLSANEEVNRTMDAISWADLTEAWRLAAHAHQNGNFMEMHQYKFSEMFWRKLETQDVPIQEITRMLRLLIDNPVMFYQKRQAIMMRMVESLYEKKDEELQFFPARGYLELLRMPEYIPMDGDSVRKIRKFLYSKIPSLLNWQEDDAERMMEIIEKKEFQDKEKIMEFLKKKSELIALR